jgi:hypothetical protein
MDPLMKELIRVTDSYKCAIKGTGTANPSEVHEIIQLYIYIYIDQSHKGSWCVLCFKMQLYAHL